MLTSHTIFTCLVRMDSGKVIPLIPVGKRLANNVKWLYWGGGGEDYTKKRGGSSLNDKSQ